LTEQQESNASQPKIPTSIRRDLKPFGGINGQAAFQKAKEEALMTEGRQYCFDRGWLTVKELDDEELTAGRCRNKNGYIPKVKGKTEYIPRHLYDEMVAEHELRFKHKLRERLDQMLDIMTGIAEDETVEPRDRFQAAQYIFERTAGKTPDTVTVNVKHAPWEELLSQVAGIAPMSRDEHRRLQVGIVDAECIEVDENGVPVDYFTEGDICYGKEAQTNPKDPHSEARSASFTPYGDWDASTATMPTVERPGEAASTVGPSQEELSQEEPYQDEPELNYGRRADEARSYAEQARDAQALARRRKEAKDKIRNATKQRKIARAMGADAIKDGPTITGVSVDDDGKMRFEQE
jgi:hypothetical protein